MEDDLLEHHVQGELIRPAESCAEADNGNSVTVIQPAMMRQNVTTYIYHVLDSRVHGLGQLYILIEVLQHPQVSTCYGSLEFER